MGSRLLLLAFGLFWGTMTLLLWRSEYGPRPQMGTPVDANMVWHRILTSLDSSSLAIIHREKRIGFCHLITSVADSLNQSNPTNAPEGMVRNVGSYKLDLSGSLEEAGTGARIRFDGEMTLSRDQEWEDFRIQIIARPLFLTLTSSRTEGVIHLKMEGPEFRTERVLRLSDLNQPESMLAQLFGPAAPLALNALPFSLPDNRFPASRQDLQWTATTDRLAIGTSASLVYRLQLKPMEGYSVVILVSRAGEILRVELPESLTLVNEAITGL